MTEIQDLIHFVCN